MTSPLPDPYAVLGVPRGATAAEITHAYRDLLRAHHPDIREDDPHQTGDPDAELRRVLAAYAILRDPDHRAAYDRRHPALRRSSAADVVPSTEPPPIQAGPVYWWSA